MRRLAVVLALAGAACQQPRISIEVAEPHAGALELPELSGAVIVTRDAAGDDELGRGAIELDGERFTARVAGLPVGEATWVRVEWHAAGLLVARTEPKAVRLAAGSGAAVEVALADYLYPDGDGDGAQDILELAAISGVAEAVAAARDPAVAPVGFFNGFGKAIPLAGFVGGLSVDSYPGEVLAAHFETDDMVSFRDHGVSLVTPGNRRRWTTALPSCAADAVAWNVVQRSTERAAVLCTRAAGTDAGDHVVIIDPDSVPAPTVVRTAATPGADFLFHAKGASLVFAVGFERVYAVDLYRTEPVVETLVLAETLPGVSLASGADTGDLLILTDRGQNALVLVEHDGASMRLVGRALVGQLSSPFGIAVHPRLPRAYVANEEDGTVRVVDISHSDPSAWAMTSVVHVGAGLDDAVLDPSGHWLYAVASNRLARIDTLTNRVGWEIVPGGSNGISGVSISEDGRFGALQLGRSLLTLAVAPPELLEHEPNEEPALATSVVSPEVGHAFGWVDAAEAGSLELTWRWNDAGGTPREAVDDLEDVWKLEHGGAPGRLLVALVPGFEHMTAVALLGPGGDVLQWDYFWSSGYNMLPGDGVFFVSEPVAGLPEPLYLGVSGLDLVSAFAPYELIVSTVPDPLPVLAEVEPNGDWASAQVLGVLPLVVTGHVDAADTGPGNDREPPLLDDFEDCFRVNTTSSRVGVRVEPMDPTADVNLLSFDSAGARLPGLAYWVDSPGEPEIKILEPSTSVPETMICVGIRDSDAVSATDYRLLVVDLGT